MGRASPHLVNLGAPRHVEIRIWTPWPGPAGIQELHVLDISRCESLYLTVPVRKEHIPPLSYNKNWLITPGPSYQVISKPCTHLQRLQLDSRFFKPPDDVFTWIAENLGFGLTLEVETDKGSVFAFIMRRTFESVPYVESLRLIPEGDLVSNPVLTLRECTHPLSVRHLRRVILSLSMLHGSVHPFLALKNFNYYYKKADLGVAP